MRALSKVHARIRTSLPSMAQTVRYLPAESDSGLFGGNSNWRGPIWFPLNYLMIESLQKFHHYYGDEFKIECPTGSRQFVTIGEVANELSRRLTRIFSRTRAAVGQCWPPRRAVRRSALPGPCSVPRVFQWRHGPGCRGVTPDRLDRLGGQVAPTAPDRAAGVVRRETGGRE